MSFAFVETAIASFKRGDLVMIMDSDDREGKCYLVFAAATTTPAQMAFAIRQTSGIVWVSTDVERLEKFGLHPATSTDGRINQTNLYVSTNFLPGTTTGTSAADRARTAQALCDLSNPPESFSKPGHTIPLCARIGGVLEREGLAEAAFDMCRLAKMTPVGVIAELMCDDGSLFQKENAFQFAQTHGIPLVTVGHIVEHRTKLHFTGTTDDLRSFQAGTGSRWAKPVVLCTPGLQDLAESLRQRLGCEAVPDDVMSTLVLDRFKSGDADMKFNWKRIVGREVIFLFDTVDQTKLIEQLAVVQALQGFAVPDSEDKATKWKTYVDQGKYAWGRAAKVTVVLPWYRPCQMERTSRWHFADGKWTNSNPEGQWLDVPTALYFARLLSTPGSVPPLPGPSESLDDMPLNPLWRPPLELLFIELHEEVPVSHSVSDLKSTVRMQRFVPFMLDKFKKDVAYPGKACQYVLFPDKGAFDRYASSVSKHLELDDDHILYITKVRVGDAVEQTQKLFFGQGKPTPGVKEAFRETDQVLIIDDFTNSGSTLFGAVNLARKLANNSTSLKVTIFVSHLVGTYDTKVIEGIAEKLKALGPDCRFWTTNTLPSTTSILKDNPQVKIFDVAEFIAELVVHRSGPVSRL